MCWSRPCATVCWAGVTKASCILLSGTLSATASVSASVLAMISCSCKCLMTAKSAGVGRGGRWLSMLLEEDVSWLSILGVTKGTSQQSLGIACHDNIMLIIQQAYNHGH
jgi:hypothetical protein